MRNSCPITTLNEGRYGTPRSKMHPSTTPFQCPAGSAPDSRTNQLIFSYNQPTKQLKREFFPPHMQNRWKQHLPCRDFRWIAKITDEEPQIIVGIPKRLFQRFERTFHDNNE